MIYLPVFCNKTQYLYEKLCEYSVIFLVDPNLGLRNTEEIFKLLFHTEYLVMVIDIVIAFNVLNIPSNISNTFDHIS